MSVFDGVQIASKLLEASNKVEFTLDELRRRGEECREDDCYPDVDDLGELPVDPIEWAVLELEQPNVPTEQDRYEFFKANGVRMGRFDRPF